MDLITAISYVFKDAAAIISILMMMHFVFLDSFKRKIPRICIITAVVLLNAFVGVFVLMKKDPTFDELMDFISNVIFIVAARALTNQKKTIKIIWIVMLYLMTVEMFYSLVSDYISPGLFFECLSHGIMFSAVGVLIYIFSVKSRYNLLPRVFDEIPRWVFVAVMFFDLTCYYKEFGLSQKWYEAMYTVSSALLIICVMYLFYRIFRLSYEQNAAIRQLALQGEHYEKRLSDESSLRSFRHDYKNHMIVIDSYLKSGKIQEASDYLKIINEDIKEAVNPVNTGNFVADAVISNKKHQASEKGISIVFSGAVPSEGIEPQDICLIFSNLIDNAIRACEKLESQKQINIRCGLREKSFILSIENPCAEDLKIKKGILKTTKTDKKNHGIGLRNVKATAEKYGGELTLSCENKIFTADVRMTVNFHTLIKK